MMSVRSLISLVAKAPYPPFVERRASKYSVTNIGDSSMELVEKEEKEEDEEREGEEEDNDDEDEEEGAMVGGIVIVWR
jgi:hypothetical protein